MRVGADVGVLATSAGALREVADHLGRQAGRLADLRQVLVDAAGHPEVAAACGEALDRMEARLRVAAVGTGSLAADAEQQASWFVGAGDG